MPGVADMIAVPRQNEQQADHRADEDELERRIDEPLRLDER